MTVFDDPGDREQFRNSEIALCPLFYGLLLHVHLDVGFGDFHTIDIAGGVGRDSFRRCGGRTWVTAPGICNEGGRLAVADASDADATSEARVSRIIRFGIGNIKNVISIDEQPTRAAKLLPFLDKFPVLIEYLDSAVGAVGHEQSASRIHCERMGNVELTRARAVLAEFFDEFSSLIEFQNAAAASVPL